MSDKRVSELIKTMHESKLMASLLSEEKEQQFLVSGMSKWMPYDIPSVVTKILFDKENKIFLPSKWSVEVHEGRRVLLIPHASMDLTELYHIADNQKLMIGYAFTYRLSKLNEFMWSFLYKRLTETFQFIQKESAKYI